MLKFSWSNWIPPRHFAVFFCWGGKQRGIKFCYTHSAIFNGKWWQIKYLWFAAAFGATGREGGGSWSQLRMLVVNSWV